MRKIRVLIDDGDYLLNTQHEDALERSRDIEIVGKAGTRKALATLLNERKPDILLTVLGLQEREEESIIWSILHQFPEVQCIVISKKGEGRVELFDRIEGNFV